jgi:DNA-binding MarR family transcriptional regulator
MLKAMKSETTLAQNKPTLQRVTLLKEALQLYRIRLDEALQPHGITASQLRVLWVVAENPTASGAGIARLCSVTPQTGQETLAKLEAQGWIARHASEDSDRILVAALTRSGQRILLQAKEIAEALDRQMWDGVESKALLAMEQALEAAVAKLLRV